MTIQTKCQTPGAIFNTQIHADGIDIGIEFPKYILYSMTDDEAKLLEANIHNLLEIALAPYFKDKE